MEEFFNNYFDKQKIKAHKKAVLYSFIILLFTILPTLFGVFYVKINSEDFTLEKFYKGGEFLLYSVSFLSSSYVIFESLNLKKSDSRTFVKTILIVSLVLTSICFAFLTASKNPNLRFIGITSLCFFLIGFFMFYYSQFLSNLESPNLGDQRRGEQSLIEDSLN